jgi:hypothetical protein
VEIGRRIILLFSLGRKRSQRLIFKYSKTFVRDTVVGILVGRRSIRRMFEFVLVSWFIF